jgi:hypothetical protein
MRLEVEIELPTPDLEIHRINPGKVYVTYRRLPASSQPQDEASVEDGN